MVKVRKVLINGKWYLPITGGDGSVTIKLSDSYEIIHLLDDNMSTFTSDTEHVDTDAKVGWNPHGAGYAVTGALYHIYRYKEPLDSTNRLIVRCVPELTLNELLLKSETFQLFYQEAMMEK